jgi:sulfur relay (sulfurtransferase) DsrF/TusC family protein
MKPMVFTNKMCYNILIQGFNEALECLEMKEFLQTPKGMAYNDHQSNVIITREGVPDLETKENDSSLIVNYRLKEMMNFAFFRFMDRQQALAESKYCINSSEFYRKCLNALNIELTKRNLKEPTTVKEMKKIRLAPFFELDDLDPLQYLSTKKRDLEHRAFERPCQQPEPEEPQKQNDIDKYSESYKHNYFSSVIDKRDKDDKENILFYGKTISTLLKQRDSELLSKENLKDRWDLLSQYNIHLYYLTGHTMQLFKSVNNYLNTGENGYLTSIKIKEDNVIHSLKSVKDFAKTIKHNCIDDNILIASKIKDYCVLMFDDWIDVLNDNFGIDIYKSPLKMHFENVKIALESSINLDELKIINELNKVAPEAFQQIEKDDQTYIPKPCFKPELIESITEDLNTFFEASQHAELKRIIETGRNAKEKLLFRDNGNRLTDFFRQLYKVDIITGCTKKDLINWIIENFKNINGKTQKVFIYKTVEKIISSKDDNVCKNPIIDKNNNKYVKI